MGKKSGKSAPAPQSSASAEQSGDSGAGTGSGAKKNHNKYRKEKPWDHDGIDHWKVEPFKDGEMKAPLLEESAFATMFPQYREQYIREVWPIVTRELKKLGVECELNLVEGTMSVRTTRKTWDPYAILNARDLIKLLARSVPVQQALRVLEDDVACDIIKIGGMVRNRERFVKRRQRLVGPNGATLKAIELLTDCFVLVQGNTVAAMGPFKGLKQARKIVEDCMQNVHPIYNIKTLMVKRELAKDPKLAGENWDRFLPKFKKRNVKRKSGKAAGAESTKKTYTPFPPANQHPPSKLDLQLESGEYFLSAEQRDAKRRSEKRAGNAAKKSLRDAERAAQFVAPKEPKAKSKRKSGAGAGGAGAGGAADEEAQRRAALSDARKLKRSALARAKEADSEDAPASKKRRRATQRFVETE